MFVNFWGFLLLKGGGKVGCEAFLFIYLFFVVNFFDRLLFFFTLKGGKGDMGLGFKVNKYNLCSLD